MSPIDGLTASADWVAKDMEAMLRECDALIASKDEHLARLTAGIKALQAEMDQVSAERALAVADREKAEQVLGAFRVAVEKGTGLRQSRGHSQTRLRIVPDAPEPEEASKESASPAEDGAEDPTPPTAATPKPESAAIRVSGERSVAVMQIVTAEPNRDWTPRDIALRLEGPDAGQEQAAHNRARALLDSLARRKVLYKRRDGNYQRCVFRLAAVWEAA